VWLNGAVNVIVTCPRSSSERIQYSSGLREGGVLSKEAAGRK